MQERLEAQKAIKSETLSGEETEQAESFIEQSYRNQRVEGFPADDELWEEYMSTREKGESYADWYRRTRILPAKLQGQKLPGPNWVGW